MTSRFLSVVVFVSAVCLGDVSFAQQDQLVKARDRIGVPRAATDVRVDLESPLEIDADPADILCSIGNRQHVLLVASKMPASVALDVAIASRGRVWIQSEKGEERVSCVKLPPARPAIDALCVRTGWHGSINLVNSIQIVVFRHRPIVVRLDEAIGRFPTVEFCRFEKSP